MSTTLTNGLKLPDKGSVDWYADMQSNYTILDGAVGTVAEHTTQIAGKAPLVHTHTKADITDFPAYGTTAGTICEGNDSRLSDARTPVAHTHTKSDVTDLLNSNFIPSANNTYDLGSFSNQWSNVYANEVKTTLVDPYTNTMLLVRSTDNTWDNGARMFLYSNSYLSQGYGQFYLDVDHGDNNHTKTAVTLAPNSFHPQGGTVNTTYGVSLGTVTAQWAKVYAEQYYYNGTAWGLDIDNHWKRTQVLHSDVTIDIVNNPSNEIIGSALYWQDNARFWAQYVPVWGTDGSFRLELGISNYYSNGSQGYWTIVNKISKDFGAFDFYTTHSAANLGTSTYKWKTLNGINPGALSLPNLDSDGYTDLSGNISANAEYLFTPAYDGWLALYCQTTGFHAENAVGIFNREDAASYRWANTITSSINLLRYGKYHGSIILPVRAGIQYGCWVVVNSSTPLATSTLFFYKAKGNV